jgi:radical SAM superfamily enzyme YgiQ (UPF0313 family)
MMIRNHELWGTSGYIFSDSTFNSSKKKLDNFFNMVSTLPFDIEYSCFCRVDGLHGFEKELISSGCKSIHFGIETIDQDLLRKHKHCSTDVVAELNRLTDIWKDKITTIGSFIVGLEGETEKTARKTGEWLLSDKNPLTNFVVGSFINHEIKTPGFAPKIEKWTIPIVNEINSNRIVKFAGFSYSRMRNIGYTEKEINEINSAEKQLVKDNITTLSGIEVHRPIKKFNDKILAEIMTRRNKLKSDYFNNLLKI